ncbi:MAG: class I SAM-dependent methyltransferase [Bacteroidales bacterium]|jgi:SAM-dependent methyltransferase|nr:class I SAM-dependent methyltransferase [Bacteroidales bacterium]
MINEALHFNNNLQIYNEIRPGYPKELYRIISKYKTFDKNSNILEIGSGNGIASEDIYNTWKTKLVLIEPGKEFYELLNNKFIDYKDITIENTTFEDYQNKIQFDAIFAATSFHWIDMSVKYKKSNEMLKDDGVLIIYWNNYIINNKLINNKIQNIYRQYENNRIKRKLDIYKTQKIKIENRRKEIEHSEYFILLKHKIIKWRKKYTSDEYIKLLRTFPDNKNKDMSFFDQIRQEIMKNRNEIEIQITVNLEIAKKLTELVTKSE